VTVTTRHDLFGVDPADFVAERDALARHLRSEGQREEAAAVKALRRPAVPIWALNQVARDDVDAIDALIAAAADAQEEQDALLDGGGDRDALREALTARRAALRHVVHRASEVIERSGRPPGTQQRQVEDALNAVTSSDALAELLRAGELVEITEDEADEDLASLLGASVTTRARASKKKPSPVTDLSEARAAKQAAAARKDVERLKKAADRAAGALDKARRSLTDAAADVEEARERLGRAEAKAEEAREAEEAAKRAHDDAVEALQQAEE